MSAAQNTSIECDTLGGDDSWLSDPSVNFTLVFTSCPQTCLIAYGSANPDLAGIGALVSYATLALLNFIFTIYNNNQELLSVSENNKYIGDGDYHDFTLIQDNKQQAPFVQIRGSADDVCVAYVSATFVDGQKRGWDASWGKAFNMHWYYSGVYPGEDSSQTGYCVWLNDEVGTFYINMPGFSGAGEPSDDVNSYAGYDGLRVYQDRDGKEEMGLPFSDSKMLKSRSEGMGDRRLVLSDHPGHNVTELCTSASSRGPDLVSLAEGLYCDMDSREVIPICDGNVADDCFHLDGEGVKRRDVPMAKRKTYSETIDWSRI